MGGDPGRGRLSKVMGIIFVVVRRESARGLVVGEL